MPSYVVNKIATYDARFSLPAGAGSDSLHTNPEYCFAVALVETEGGLCGTGIALTLGDGNRLVCEAIELLAKPILGMAIEELMSGFGRMSRRLADDPSFRWLGPHKGVVHLALASLTNACFDLWAKSRGVPLWRLLLDLDARKIVDLLDLSYLEDILTRDEAEATVRNHVSSRREREGILRSGYPGYHTSVGWFQYEDSQLKDLARQSKEKGFHAFKLKVGSRDGQRDVRRAFMLREFVGANALIMLDANQQWTLPRALEMCHKLRDVSPYFVEEPTHPDDIRAHSTLAEGIKPIPIALGEHVPNRIMFKNFMQAEAVQIVQADCTRVAGIAEVVTVSLLARKFGLRVVPHVGDMGQIHQHLVLFNHIALGHEAVFLECIPHLQPHFVNPAHIENGVYVTTQAPGCSSDLKGVHPGA